MKVKQGNAKKRSAKKGNAKKRSAKKGNAKKGSALILTMFILTGMLIVAMSSSYIILVGIRAGGIQSQSTKAYFTAEAGAENFLWEMRKDPAFSPSLSQSDTEVVLIGGTMSLSDANYKVYYSRFSRNSKIYTSIGEFKNTKRSVELEFGN